MSLSFPCGGNRITMPMTRCKQWNKAVTLFIYLGIKHNCIGFWTNTVSSNTRTWMWRPSMWPPGRPHSWGAGLLSLWQEKAWWAGQWRWKVSDCMSYIMSIKWKCEAVYSGSSGGGQSSNPTSNWLRQDYNDVDSVSCSILPLFLPSYQMTENQELWYKTSIIQRESILYHHPFVSLIIIADLLQAMCLGISTETRHAFGFLSLLCISNDEDFNWTHWN